MGRRALLPAGRGLIVTDLLVVVWVVFWCVVAIRVGVEVRDVGRISGSVERVGRAVSDTGDALKGLSDVPVLGDRLSAPAKPIAEAGAAAQLSARQSRSSARDLSILLALTIALAPTLPMLLLYLPDRIAVSRDRRSIARATERGMPAELAEALARRAAVHVPMHRLLELVEDPHAEIAAGRYDVLARAELRRMGIH